MGAARRRRSPLRGAPRGHFLRGALRASESAMPICRTRFSSTSLTLKNKKGPKGPFSFSGGERGMAASRRRRRLRRCSARTGLEVLNPLGKNTKGPKRGLSYFGGERGIGRCAPSIGRPQGHFLRPLRASNSATPVCSNRSSSTSLGKNAKGPKKGPFDILAEREGFEPSVRYHRTLAFQASTLNHSAISPNSISRFQPAAAFLCTAIPWGATARP